jgi:hypothetical protein
VRCGSVRPVWEGAVLLPAIVLSRIDHSVGKTLSLHQQLHKLSLVQQLSSFNSFTSLLLLCFLLLPISAPHNMARNCSCSPTIAGDPATETDSSAPDQPKQPCHDPKCSSRPPSIRSTPAIDHLAKTAARHNIKRQCSCSTSIAGEPSSTNASGLEELNGEKPEIRITLPSRECSLCVGERIDFYLLPTTQASQQPAGKTPQSETTTTAERHRSSHSVGSAGADSNDTQGTQIITKPSVCERDINGEASGGFWLMPAIKRLISPPTRIFPRRSLILTPPRGPRDGMGSEEIYNPRGDNIAEGLGITGLAGNNLGRGRSGISVTSSSETGDTDTKGDRKVKHWAHLFHAIAAMVTITLILALWLHLNCRHGGETGTEEKVECYATPLDLWRMIYLYCLCFGTMTSYLVYVNLMCSKVVPLAHQVVSLSFTLCCHSRSII